MRLLAAAMLVIHASAAPYSLADGQKLLKVYCAACHQGKSAVAGFDISRMAQPDSPQSNPRLWTKAAARMRAGEMPPKGKPAPSFEERDQFLAFTDSTLHAAACSDGITPRPAPIRRLNRSEYGATVRDLLNIHFNAGSALPSDGAGGEGFDNAAETLFLSPIHAEKYLEAAKIALEYGISDPRSRSRFMISEPDAITLPIQSARAILESFLPRAFRRPVSQQEVGKHLVLFERASKRGDSFDQAIAYSLQAALISPHFLFRYEHPNPEPAMRPAGDYEIASRLSYFLWGSMPDDTLFQLAAQGQLRAPEVLKAQAIRLLTDQRSTEFASQFVEQWLNTRELGRDIKPDQKLFPAYYDAEIQSAIRYEPILFFQEIFTSNLSLLNLIDSKFTILTNKLQRHYGIQTQTKLSQQPKRADLPADSHRGGLLGMAAVLAVSSYPHRTSPVLRGKWILDAMLGTPPPPPPPNVPQLKEQDGELPQTLRERLTLHRSHALCAGCHSRIDPLGFGLENYGVLGQWRTEDSGKPIDSKGELTDGARFDGPDELRAVLMAKKDVFLRNLANKMLGYALGRGLTIEDHCAVDQIVEQVKKQDYSAHTLIMEVVLSTPFRYQPGAETK